MIPRPPRRPTVRDVAASAGVSTTTASRALSGMGYVSGDVRQRVQVAASELGYIPNANARTLRVGFGRDVGLVITTLRNPFYSELATAIEAGLHELGYDMILATDNGDEREQLAAIDRLMSMRVAGIILTPVSTAAIERLLRNQVRVVQVDRVVGRRKTDAVLSGNRAGAREATEHLLEHGHTQIAMLIDEVRWTTGRGRLEGFRAAFTERRMAITEGLVMFGSNDVLVARHQVGRLLDLNPGLTAIMAGNGLLAEAAFRELQARGLVIPHHMSLVAYDDVPWMSMVQPPITAVSQHTADMGAACAELLVTGLRSTGATAPVSRSISPSLLVRGSVGTVRS